jgi:hypothetical protein
MAEGIEQLVSATVASLQAPEPNELRGEQPKAAYEASDQAPIQVAPPARPAKARAATRN